MSYTYPPAPRRRSWLARHWLLLTVLAVLAVLLIACAAALGSSGDDPDPAPTTAPPVRTTAAPTSIDPTRAPTPTATGGPTTDPAPPAGAAATIPGDGTFLVGTDVRPGTYRGRPAADSPLGSCYYARLKGTSGDFEDIIANDNITGPSVVTIKPTDAAFKTTGCEDWVRVP
jgi:hypothetical protein